MRHDAHSTDAYDDGRVIASMRGVDGLEPPTPADSARDFAEELQSPEKRMMVILGTLKAALSIGMVYVIAFGIAIAFMLWLWT